MLLGYNTNGFPHHRLDDALNILADLGYQSVAITLDYHALDPYSADLKRQLAEVRGLLERHRLRSVIETGARFLLDPRRKHQPTLVSPTPEERARRLDFLRRAVDIAAELNADAVSFWSGTPVDAAPQEVLAQRLRDGCLGLLEYAGGRNIRLAFEPEPGMFIDSMNRFASLKETLPDPRFGLTIDIGHLYCQGELPITDQLQRWKDLLWNIHIDDMRPGVHEHLMFGKGEIDFGAVLGTLHEIGYTGGVHVELSRHGHDAVRAAEKARDFLLARWPQEEQV